MNLLPILLGFLDSLDFMFDRNGDEPLGTSAWEAKIKAFWARTGIALLHQIANLGSVVLSAIWDNLLVMLVGRYWGFPLNSFKA